MQVSKYETQFTREQRQGVKNPSRNMENRVATERPARVKAALAREAKEKNQ